MSEFGYLKVEWVAGIRFCVGGMMIFEDPLGRVGEYVEGEVL